MLNTSLPPKKDAVVSFILSSSPSCPGLNGPNLFWIKLLKLVGRNLPVKSFIKLLTPNGEPCDTDSKRLSPFEILKIASIAPCWPPGSAFGLNSGYSFSLNKSIILGWVLSNKLAGPPPALNPADIIVDNGL